MATSCCNEVVLIAVVGPWVLRLGQEKWRGGVIPQQQTTECVTKNAKAGNKESKKKSWATTIHSQAMALLQRKPCQQVYNVVADC